MKGGLVEGFTEGEGEPVGCEEGNIDGVEDGLWEGKIEGFLVGPGVGLSDGKDEGLAVGVVVGLTLGDTVDVGKGDGALLCVGGALAVGSAVGASVGDTLDGFRVGAGTPFPLVLVGTLLPLPNTALNPWYPLEILTLFLFSFDIFFELFDDDPFPFLGPFLGTPNPLVSGLVPLETGAYPLPVSLLGEYRNFDDLPGGDTGLCMTLCIGDFTGHLCLCLSLTNKSEELWLGENWCLFAGFLELSREKTNTSPRDFDKALRGTIKTRMNVHNFISQSKVKTIQLPVNDFLCPR